MTKRKFRISDFGFRISREERGFTLIETIMIIVLVGIFMAAIGIPFVNGIRQSQIPEIVTTAHFLAVEKMEEYALRDYASMVSEARAPVSGFTGYEREVVVANVDANLNPSGSDVGYRTVTVTVYHNDLPAAGISIETLRTDY
jgi:type II secretory pathway pseudopilin PulG